MVTLNSFQVIEGSTTLLCIRIWKLKKYAKNNLGLKNVTVGEPRTFISGETCSADWNKGINAKVGLDEDRDGFKTSIWQLFNEDEPIEKKEIGLNWIADRRFRGTCTITIVNRTLYKGEP